MRRQGPDLSGYRAVWLFAMFDLPVTTKKARKEYARFRKRLLEHGFMMLQFSVYARHCPTEDSSDGVRSALRKCLPPKGNVRVVAITDRQFAKMEVFSGEKPKETEKPPPQIMLF